MEKAYGIIHENNEFFNPNWENNSMDQFESALSSMVSSPTASNNGNNGENIVLRELIGRLGSICNSGEISPNPNFTTINGNNNNNNNNNSTNTSCYSTPLNSPPKLNLSMAENQQQMRANLQIAGKHFPSLPNLTPFSTDPGFAERAARFSCFANKSLSAHLGLNEMNPKLDNSGNKISGSEENKDGIDKKFSRILSSEFCDSMENSSVSEIGINAQSDANSRKRKSTIPRGKGKDANVASEKSESSGKRSKSDDGIGNNPKDHKSNNTKTDQNQNQNQSKDNNNNSTKDYIHVRARRGQATDAHSLAERVRREKISERMKLLQDLVPGCNKVTGKAVMLDEIINYVQSLQRQVEFLSMKLATVNPRMDLNMEALMSKDVMFQSRNIYPSESYPIQSQPNLHTAIPNGTEANNFSTALGRYQSMQLPPIDNFTEETASQISTFWEDDLHSIVQMGFGQNQTQNFHGILPTAQMKVEL